MSYMATRFPVSKQSKTRFQTTYSLVADVGMPGKDGGNGFENTIKTIQHWIQEKLPYDLPPASKDLSSYILEEGGQRVECVSISEAGLWAVRLSHPDMGLGDVKAVAGRHWTSDVCVAKVSDKVRFAIKVGCSSPVDNDEPLTFIRPGLVRRIIERVGASQDIPLSERPWILKEDKDLALLENLIASKERRLPVILLTQPDKRRWDLTPTPPLYMVRGDYLARKTVGYAHVVQIPFELGFEWTRKVGQPWSAFDGAIRIYMPNLNFSEDSLNKHPIFFRNDIHAYEADGKKSGPAFAEYLIGQMSRYNATRRLSWVGVPFVPDARMKKADFEAAKITGLTNTEDLRERYESQISALREKLKEAEQEAEQWSDEAVEAAHNKEHYEEENKNLRQQIDVLRLNLEAKVGQPIDNTIPIPQTFDGMVDWVNQHLAGRLILHPRAVRALKDAVYQYPDLVYRTLLALANEYRGMRMGKCEKIDFDNKCQELELRSSGSIAREKAGQYGDTYFVNYPIGSGCKQFVERHLRKGSTKDDHMCMAVYYFWDEDTNQVVVGWLPSHLKNRMT